MGSLPPHSEKAAGPSTIRRGAPEDAAFLARCNVDHGLEVENLRLDPAEVRAGVDAVLADDTKGHYWVLEIDGSLAAGLLITYEWSDWNNANYWWIQSLFVVKQHRRKGCYRQLYAHVQQHARRAGAAGVRLYADVGNVVACAMYERLGMTSHYKVYEASFIEELKAEPEAG